MRAFFNEMIAIVTGNAPRDQQPLPAVVTGSLFYDPQIEHLPRPYQYMEAVAVRGQLDRFRFCTYEYEYDGNREPRLTRVTAHSGMHTLAAVVTEMATYHRDMMAAGHHIEGNNIIFGSKFPNLDTVARAHSIPCNLLVKPTSVPVRPTRLEEKAMFN